MIDAQSIDTIVKQIQLSIEGCFNDTKTRFTSTFYGKAKAFCEQKQIIDIHSIDTISNTTIKRYW